MKFDIDETPQNMTANTPRDMVIINAAVGIIRCYRKMDAAGQDRNRAAYEKALLILERAGVTVESLK